ncbi:MAG TPA: YqgE/AlgH family protein [Burkholderiales bacterium]|jgi:putative transcriptional regulator|nr:YqgE/AlgH family protein [Burkholderiales bacterium]
MRWALVVLLLAASSAFAQPNGILLVAKPGMPDPNFSETVVLVAWAEDSSTVGVILNRPSMQQLVDIAPNWPGAVDFKQPIYSGGPVMRQVLVALFESKEEPKARAFRVLPNLYLSMHPGNLEPLVARPPARLRLYAGFSGWAPRQLESEVDRGTWFMLRATEDVIFRKDTTGMWQELVEKAQGSRTFLDSPPRVAAR